ncbi:MAG: NtaA/DmoA family FMN-dependent monooxygenase [Pseudomonadales bacterium]|jgi:FMN-dependent oxidoreductase (nitrilotriacetate monooxygenase family)|nr:NtaA/DmoA family FMN-dependent monooxygenase [Pseudomonadales bacterium]
MHLTGFVLACPAPHMIMSWIYPEDQKFAGNWTDIEYWGHIARTLERAKFDMMFFADGWSGGVNASGIKYAIQFPVHDPTTIVPYLSAVAPKLGYALTMSTTFYEPYMLARKLASLDHVTGGKIGWNIVCSISSGEAKNFGMDDLPDHDVRYGRADEFMDVCNKLWSSWDEGALLMDGDRGIFADPDKIHKINHVGNHFAVQGPLTVAPSPQGRPYLFQAGASDRGRNFAVDHADCIFAFGNSPAQMRSFVDDIKNRAENSGRDPESIKILWSAQPVVAQSSHEARLRLQEIRERIPLEASITLMSGHFNIDLTQFDLDTPVNQFENLNITGTRGMFEAYTAGNPEITLREIAGSYLSSTDDSPFAGTGKEVADNMIQMLAEGGGHGFQITPSYYAPKFFEDITETLIPPLQERKVFRQEYTGNTLRDYMAKPT